MVTHRVGPGFPGQIFPTRKDRPMFKPSSFQQLTLVARHLLHSTEGTPELNRRLISF